MASRGQQMRKNASLNEGEHEGRGGRFHGGQWEAGNGREQPGSVMSVSPFFILSPGLL